ncbi:hypothetical protein [Schlesneria sp.]|uniref:hypothetical protein n=1 Tax=Schlesneria sp. TaxID=2762018 RepID=UPI002F0C062D
MQEFSDNEIDTFEKEKLDFIEGEANKLFGFVLESHALLQKEALTTMNWLMGIMVGSLTLSVSILDKWTPSKEWILWGLSASLIVSAFSAVRLLFGALLNVNITPAGTEPKNLMLPCWRTSSTNYIRWVVAKNMQEKIDGVRQQNRRRGDAINSARKSIILCVTAAVVVAAVAKFKLCE